MTHTLNNHTGTPDTPHAIQLAEVEKYGPCGEAVARLVEGLRLMTLEQAQAAGDAAWEAGWHAGDIGRDAAQYAAVIAGLAAGRDTAGLAAGATARLATGVAAGVTAGDADWDAGRDAARLAARALVVADLITPHHFATLTSPIAEVMPELWAEAMALLIPTAAI